MRGGVSCALGARKKRGPVGVAAESFLRALCNGYARKYVAVAALPSSEGRRVPIARLSGTTRHVGILNADTGACCYITLHRRKLPSDIENNVKRVRAIIYVITSISILKPTRGRATLPGARRRTVTFMGDLGLGPSVVIQSNGNIRTV